METKRDQYQGLGDDYDQTFKLLPYREHIEAYSLFRKLGDLTGLSILDLACGTGIFTRALRRWGAARVVGVDISEEMVRVARAHEAESPLGIEYVVQDVAALRDLGQFDRAVAVYLLGYAATREQIVQMGRGVARNLKPGARFLTYFVSPDLSREPGHYRKYGIDFSIDPSVSDGQLMYFSLILGDTVTPKLTNHYWSKPTVTSALEEAGFTDIRWNKPELSPQGIARYGAEFWADYLRALPGVLLECTRA
jgi:ubiquinone/menaquinone biosynthesis C-methylase UbiE